MASVRAPFLMTSIGLLAALGASQPSQDTKLPHPSATDTAYLSCTTWTGQNWTEPAARAARTPLMVASSGLQAYAEVKTLVKNGSCENTTALYVASGVDRKFRIVYSKEPSASDGNGMRLIGWSPNGEKLLAEVTLWKYETDRSYAHVAVVYDTPKDSAREIPAISQAVSRHFGPNCEFELTITHWESNDEIRVTVFRTPEDPSYEQHFCVDKPREFVFDLSRSVLQLGPEVQRAVTRNFEGQCILPEGFPVVRVDESAKRLFVVGTESGVTSETVIATFLKRLSRALEQCKPTWKGSWSVSFFSDVKLAGYKTDLEHSGALESGDWGRAYIAEYDRGDQVLTIFPLDPTKRRTRRVTVSQSGQ